MGDRVPKSFDRLSGDAAVAAGLNKSDRSHQRQLELALIKQSCDGKERGLGIEGIENGFYKQDVGAAVDQPAGLIIVSLHQLLIRHPPRRRAVHIRRD